MCLPGCKRHEDQTGNTKRDQHSENGGFNPRNPLFAYCLEEKDAHDGETDQNRCNHSRSVSPENHRCWNMGNENVDQHCGRINRITDKIRHSVCRPLRSEP